MSRNAGPHGRKPDRRVRRTRNRLGDALVELIQEKPFLAITVRDLLERAGVGRSTFYSYFRDKNDLFVSGLDEFLEQMATVLVGHADAGDRVAPVRELLAHVADSRPLYDALVASGRIHDFLELGRAHFARGIEKRLVELTRAQGLTPVRRALVAHALAGALFSLLSWWIDGDSPVPPEEMDDLYHAIVWSAVTSVDSGPISPHRPR